MQLLNNTLTHSTIAYIYINNSIQVYITMCHYYTIHNSHGITTHSNFFSDMNIFLKKMHK